MKACPYCAEEIQDAAIICKHCNRDLTTTKPKTRTPRLGFLIAGGLVAALLIARAVSPSAQGSFLAQQQGTPKPPAVTTELVNNNSVEIPAGEYVQYGFRISRTDCRLTGRVEGVDGGQKEVEVRVLTRDDLINWKNQPNNTQFGLYQSPRETVTNLDVALPSAGDWVLVVSNHWATFVGKTALVHASVTCG